MSTPGTAPVGATLRPPWVDIRLQRDLRRPRRKVHLDFHNTPAVGAVGEGFDAQEFTQTLQSGHVDSIVVFAKDMHGYFYYPDGRGPVHPGLRRDLLQEQVAACRAAGITVSAYYCVTWDNYLAERHPEWLVFKRDRTTYLPAFDGTPHWTALCLSAPEFVEHVLADSREILQRYDLDGIWYDMPLPIAGECFCHRCLAAISAAGGDPFDVPTQRRHKQQLLADFMSRSRDLARELRPGIVIDQNNQTRTGLGERAPLIDNIDIEALPTGGWGYQYFPVDSRFSRNFGTPITGQTGRFMAHWADFGGLKHPRQLEVEVAGILAQGAYCCVGDQPGPSGRLDPAVYETIGAAYGRVELLEEYLRGAAPVTEAGIVIDGPPLLDVGAVSAANHADPDSTAVADSVAGLARLLRDARVQFDIVDADGDLDHYRLLVVPEGIAVSAELADALARHVEHGGAVIAVGASVAVPGSTRPWAPGLDLVVHGRSPYTVPFLVPTEFLAQRVRQFEYALYHGAERWEVEPGSDMQVLATLAEPAFDRAAEHFTSHAHSPVATRTGYATAVVAGRVGAIGFPLGSAYRARGYWVYREVFEAVLDAVLPERLVRSSVASAAEISLTQQQTASGPRWLAHIVNTSTDVRWGTHLEFFEQDLPLHDVELVLNLPGGVGRARLADSGAELPVTPTEDGARVVISRVGTSEIVVLEPAVVPEPPVVPEPLVAEPADG